jgi:hypothetical protein
MIRNLRLVFFLLVSSSCIAQAQNASKKRIGDHFSCASWLDPDSKGKYYIAFGYNKDWYTRSDIRVHDDENNTMDFTLYDMTARDRPDIRNIFRLQLSIPQYGYRMGYWFPSGRFGVEINFDHAKYIVNDNQTARIDGHINGVQVSGDTLVTPHFLHLEHTDGANFLMFNIMYRQSLLQRKYLSTSWITKLGGGMVVPRSDVTLFGQRWNHCFHVAGQVFGIETGFRTEFFRFFFLETTVKGAYANYANVLAINPILISHRFGTFMVEAHAGFQLPVGKRKNWKYISPDYQK